MNLKERLDRIRDGAVKRIPEEKRAIMHRATEDLRKSGILNSVLKTGEKMPFFSLKNARGKMVHSQDRLAAGPLVVSFFRGKW